MKIWLINHSFRPETNAPANRFLGLATAWQAAEQDVRMLAGTPHRPHGQIFQDYQAFDYSQPDEVAGITIWRHKEKVGQRGGAMAELFKQLSFAFQILRRNMNRPEAERPDVVIASSPDFFHVISGWLLARRYGARFVFEVRDLWPEIFRDMGVVKSGAALSVMGALARFMYRRADMVVTVTKGYAEQLQEKGVDPQKITIIPNAVNDGDFDALDTARENRAGQSLRSELKINPMAHVVLYIGNHGKAQALGQIIDAARTLMDRTDIQFLLVGDGSDKPRLADLARGLPNVMFLDNQPKDKVWAFYDMCTLSVSCLRDIEAFNTTIPSKIYEIMAAQKPIVAALKGEAADIVAESGGGVVTPREAPEKLATAIAELVDDPERMKRMAAAGRAWADQNRRYSNLAPRYLKALEALERS